MTKWWIFFSMPCWEHYFQWVFLDRVLCYIAQRRHAVSSVVIANAPVTHMSSLITIDECDICTHIESPSLDLLLVQWIDCCVDRTLRKYFVSDTPYTQYGKYRRHRICQIQRPLPFSTLTPLYGSSVKEIVSFLAKHKCGRGSWLSAKKGTHNIFSLFVGESFDTAPVIFISVIWDAPYRQWVLYPCFDQCAFLLPQDRYIYPVDNTYVSAPR